MDREKVREKVKKDIRALLISAPLGVPAHIFAKDYRQMNGKDIPFRELGHRSLDEFVLSIPDVVRVGTGPTGLVTFYPIATKETQHIVNMIKRQRKPAIRKAIIPSAIMARKTPVKMSSFSRRGGARFTPRGGMGGYRHQARNHPRSYSQPSSFPNLPPRMQRQQQHPHFATYHPPSSSSFRHFSYTSYQQQQQQQQQQQYLSHPHQQQQQSHPYQSHPHQQHMSHPHQQHMSHPHQQHQGYPQQQHQGYPRNQPGGGGGGGGARPRLGSVPEGNRLHPQHTLASVKSPLSPTKTRQQQLTPPSFSTSSATSSASGVGGALGASSGAGGVGGAGGIGGIGGALGASSGAGGVGGAGGIGGALGALWMAEFQTARQMSIEELNSWTGSKNRGPIKNPVCVEGVTGRQREDVFQEKKVLKILLWTSRFRRGRTTDSQAEAVQLHFIAPFWDLQTYRQPYEVPEGVKLRVYGNVFAAHIKAKNKDQPAMRVLYYERMEGSSSSGGSTHSSPRESRATTPKMERNPSALEENIFKLLLRFEKGTYAKRLGKVYQSEFKTTPPDNLLEKARAFPFVKMEKITAEDSIMILKEEYRRRGSLQTVPSPQTVSSASSPQTVSSASSPQRVSSALPSRPASTARPPPPPPGLPGSMSLSSEDPDRLYEVQVCVVNSPFSFYVQIRDGDQHLKIAELEKKMNQHYRKTPTKAETLEVRENDLCASLWVDGEEGQWCRALVTSVHDSKVNVVFPDYGNQECVDVSDLRILPPQFYQLPYQAIHCCLHGVLRGEEMQGSEVDEYFANMASDKICALHVVDCSGARASVEILDSELDDDETINSKLITKFHPIASLAPKLPSPGEPMVAAKLADVNEHGELSIQLVGPGLSKLEELANQIEERYTPAPGSRGGGGGGGGGGGEVVVGEVYCAEYTLDSAWYRVKVCKEVSPQKVLVEYVDYGNEEEVEKSDLRPKLDTPLFSLPSQVVKCLLAKVPRGMWTDSATDYLVAYINIDDLNLEVVDYCVKVMGSSSRALPVVNLHMKSSEQEMVCVNDEMLRDPSLFNSSGGKPLPSQQQTSAGRPYHSVSSDNQVVEDRAAVETKRSQSVSSAPLIDFSKDTTTEGDAVFFNQPSAASIQQRGVRVEADTSETDSAIESSKTYSDSGVPASNGQNGVQTHTLQVREESSGDTSSVSSLNQTASDLDSEDALCEPENTNRHDSSAQKSATDDLTKVFSPKVCIRDGVHYLESPRTADVVSGHLAAPPSATRSTSSSLSSHSPSLPPGTPAPLVSSNSPLSPSSAPVTPPMSPPLLSPSEEEEEGQLPARQGGRADVNEWAELPSGRTVEVEVTWAHSPTNFTMLVLSNKSELDSMTDRLQELVKSEPIPPLHTISPGFVCAARSLDSLWYRARVKKPVQVNSLKVEMEFLDYGGSEMLPLSALKCLPNDCRQLPFQAVKASLFGVSGDVSSSPKTVRRFQNLVLRKMLYALGKDFTRDTVAVLLVDTSAEHDVVINKEFST